MGRDALSRIDCITASLPNAGLRSLSGGEGSTITSRWYQNGRAAAPYDYICGVVEHQGDPVFYWLERASSADFNAEFVVDVHVARYHDGAVEYLGTPFRYGAQTIGYSQSALATPNILGIALPMLASDETDLYCVAQILVPEDFFQTYDQLVRLWKLACVRWDGGTSWADHGFDEPRTVNSSGVKSGSEPGDSPFIFGFDARPDTQQPISELCYRAASVTAIDGSVYASWYEVGDVDTITTGPFNALLIGDYELQGKVAFEQWYHIARFTGPGPTGTVIYPLHDQLKVWDGANTDPIRYVDATDTTRAVNSIAFGSAGGVPIGVVEYDVFTAGVAGGVPNIAVYNLDSGDVIQDGWPNAAWSSGQLAETTAPRQLLWDDATGVYYTTAADPPEGGFNSAVFYVVSLSADGSVWDLVPRNGGTLPPAENPKDGINPFAGPDVPYNRAAPWATTFEPLPVLGVETENVFLLNQSFFEFNAGDLSLYAWIPCPNSGPFDDSAWDVMRPWRDVATPAFVAPNTLERFGVDTYNRNSTVAAGVKIGDHVYVICAEIAHFPYDHIADHGDYRVYDFVIGRGIDSTCKDSGLHVWQRL